MSEQCKSVKHVNVHTVHANSNTGTVTVSFLLACLKNISFVFGFLHNIFLCSFCAVTMFYAIKHLCSPLFSSSLNLHCIVNVIMISEQDLIKEIFELGFGFSVHKKSLFLSYSHIPSLESL